MAAAVNPPNGCGLPALFMVENNKTKGYTMSHNHRTQNNPLSTEDMLIALDQLDQTVEVMGAVIKRLKRNLDQAIPKNPHQDSSPPSFDFANIPGKRFPGKGWH